MQHVFRAEYVKKKKSEKNNAKAFVNLAQCVAVLVKEWP